MVNYAQKRAMSWKVGGFFTVLIVHAIIVYGLVTGSAHQVVERIRQPLMTTIIQEVKPPDQPPPLKPQLAPPPLPFIPLPEIKVRQPPTANAITQETKIKPVEPPPVAPPKKEAVRVPPVIDAAHSCQKPDYPAMSRRLEETGTVVLDFLIDVDGKVIDSKVTQSSGSARLDEAARQALALCNFKPGSVDGKPERSWAQLRYDWILN